MRLSDFIFRQSEENLRISFRTTGEKTKKTWRTLNEQTTQSIYVDLRLGGDASFLWQRLCFSSDYNEGEIRQDRDQGSRSSRADRARNRRRKGERARVGQYKFEGLSQGRQVLREDQTGPVHDRSGRSESGLPCRKGIGIEEICRYVREER